MKSSVKQTTRCYVKYKRSDSTSHIKTACASLWSKSWTFIYIVASNTESIERTEMFQLRLPNFNLELTKFSAKNYFDFFASCLVVRLFCITLLFWMPLIAKRRKFLHLKKKRQKFLIAFHLEQIENVCQDNNIQVHCQWTFVLFSLLYRKRY